eukprot:10105716-Lingulodinium_polyedra.AAC.1
MKYLCLGLVALSLRQVEIAEMVGVESVGQHGGMFVPKSFYYLANRCRDVVGVEWLFLHTIFWPDL